MEEALNQSSDRILNDDGVFPYHVLYFAELTVLQPCVTAVKNSNKNHSDRNITFIERSPFWEALSRYPGKEFPRILWQPKLHYRVNTTARSWPLS